MTNPGGRSLEALPRSRGVAGLAALWMLAAFLAVRQAAEVLRLPPGERLTDLETWIGDNGVLHLPGWLYQNTDAFTGTPFAGLVLRPLSNAAEQGLGVAWTVTSLLLVVAVGAIVARTLPEPVSRRARLVATPVAISLAVLSLPVRNTLTLGQLSILPVLLVLVGCRPATPRRTAGILVGVAAAVQPAALLFLPFLWLAGRRRVALTAAGTFTAATALAWAALPKDSVAYWVHHVAGVGLGDPSDSVSNQSIHGLLLRLDLRGGPELAVLGVLALAVAVVGIRRAAGYARDGQLLLGIAVTGCVAVAVSPVAWQYQQLWILLAAVGRVGRRRADRLVWPTFVVLVMTVGGEALVPNIDAFADLGENASLLAAVLAACVVPFLSRTSPRWDEPEKVATAPPVRTSSRWIPLLPSLPRPLSRPNLLLELLLIRAGYWAYSYVRGAAPDQRSVAEGHGRQILAIERALSIDLERWVNQQVLRVEWLKDGMNFYYSTFHFLVPLTLLAWLYLRRPVMYRAARTALSITTVSALVSFWLYPLAPPRLMPPRLGYVDTLNGPQDLTHPSFGALTKISNQYAAMPSLHVGWSLWSGLIIAALAPYLWLRCLGLLYPVATTIVIVGTANHYLLDAVGGVVVVLLGLGVYYVLTGNWVLALREVPPAPLRLPRGLPQRRTLKPTAAP